MCSGRCRSALNSSANYRASGSVLALTGSMITLLCASCCSNPFAGSGATLFINKPGPLPFHLRPMFGRMYWQNENYILQNDLHELYCTQTVATASCKPFVTGNPFCSLAVHSRTQTPLSTNNFLHKQQTFPMAIGSLFYYRTGTRGTIGRGLHNERAYLVYALIQTQPAKLTDAGVLAFSF